MRVMDRLTLTLDRDTAEAIARHARKARKPRATVARELIKEAIDRRDHLEHRRKLARDYAAGRSDARELLDDLERPQLDLLGEDS
jgi:hypothetical protein